MASIFLNDVTLDFPVYGTQRSFRSELLNKATGGFIRRDKDGVTVTALQRLSMSIEHGDRLGLIGHNGAGKSTLLKVLAGIYAPTSGNVAINGSVSSLFNISPGLDPDDTGYETIINCGMFLGMSREEIARKKSDIEQFCELGEFLSLPVRTYSSGMMVRLSFAIATAIDPEILLLDEGLGAGDARFAQRARKRVDALVDRSSILVMASHSDDLIRTMCNKAALLHGGQIIEFGNVDDVIRRYAELNQQEVAS
jgi:ABC-type polysaccharide/polyol phosphate transport system ATPase subunit